MTLPLIVLPEAESDLEVAVHQLNAVRDGLGVMFVSRVREVLRRIEAMPELHGVAWHDVRAARLKQFRYVMYYVVFADRIEVLAVLHSARDPSTWKARA